jgi:predicted phosphodiesterase
MTSARSLSIVLAAMIPGAMAAGQSRECTIAFIGDQGSGADTVGVLKIIEAEGAQAVIHCGDFDYDDDPGAWDAQITAILGENYPYFAAIGNHDEDEFYTNGGYQDLIEDRMDRVGIDWQGEMGVRCAFSFEGIRIVMIAPGIFQSMDPQQINENYLRDQFAADHSTWRIAAWHKNQRSMQVGDKSDETGWGVYETARRGGAVIATAHEHSYSRTQLLSNCQAQTIASTDPILQLARDNPATPEDEGRSFVFVSGLGGQSIRDQNRCFPVTPPYGCGGVWASIYTSDQAARFGALFATFRYGGDPRLAHFYFKNVDGLIIDEFLVRAPDSPEACRSDINDDMTVNAMDMLFLLVAWDQRGGPADITGDGIVDIMDLLMLITDFGQCN